MGEQEYVFDLGSSSVKEVCAVIQFYVDTNEGEVSCNFGTPNSHYARIEFSLSSAWHGFISFDQLTSYNEQEQRSTITLLTLHGKTTLRITPVVGDWLVFKPHVDKIIAHLLPTSSESVTGQTMEQVVEVNEYPVIKTEDDLKRAILAIPGNLQNQEFWDTVGSLFFQHKKVNRKYSYAMLAEILGMDSKHVGAMIRKHHAKTRQNTPK